MKRNKWKGYGIDELRYLKDKAVAKKEIQREKLKNSVNEIFTFPNYSYKYKNTDNNNESNFKILDYLSIGYEISNKIFLFCRIFKNWNNDKFL